MLLEDVHFYIDNAPLDEVLNVLRVLSSDTPMAPAEISQLVHQEFGYVMQKTATYSPRRLFDLGLAERFQEGARVTYLLSALGQSIQRLLIQDFHFCADLIHYLSYTTFSGAPSDRKYLWSYKRCCQIIWQARRAISPKDLAAMLQAEMRESFPDVDVDANQGARFNSTAASCVYTWLRSLQPAPINKPGEPVNPRQTDRYELTLLALNAVYRDRGYLYGDALLLSDDLTDAVSSVFFLDPVCCERVLRLAAKISSAVRLSDTLAGTSIILSRPYTVQDI